MQDTCSAFDDDCNTLDLDENDTKFADIEFPNPDKSPFKKEKSLIIPILRKKPKTSTLVIKPLLEKKGIEDSSPLIFGNIRYIITAIICLTILTIYKGNKLFTGISKKTLTSGSKRAS